MVEHCEGQHAWVCRLLDGGAAATAAAAASVSCCCQFVDGVIRGLMSWSAESTALLQHLRERVYFTQRQKVSGWNCQVTWM